jgi:hypothetical protein
MAAEGLGYLAALLGGMQQGKLMKQKRELTSAQLKQRQTDAEQKILDRRATALYRSNQNTLQQQQIDLGKANLDLKLNDTDDIYQLATQAGGNLKSSIAGIPDRMATKSTPKSWKSEVEAARANLKIPYASLRSLVQDPRMKKRFPNMTEEALLANFGGAVPQWMTDPNIDPAMPDWAQQYKPDRDFINKTRTFGFQSGIDDASWYIQKELPAYQQIMADLEGLPDAAERAIQIHGPLTGTTAQETLDLLQGKRARQIYMPTEQYRQEYGTDPLSQARGKLSFNEYGETVDEYGQSLDRLAEQENIPLDESQVPMPGQAMQRTNNYRQLIPTSQAAQVNEFMLPEKYRALKDKNDYNKINFSETLTQSAYKTLKLKGEVEGGELKNVNTHIKNLTDTLKLEFMPQKLRADIKRTLSSAFSLKTNAKVNGAKLFSEIQKTHDQNVNNKQANIVKAMNALTYSPEYMKIIAGGDAKSKAFEAYINNPKAPMPPEIGAALAQQVEVIRQMRDDLKNAISAQKTFDDNGRDFVNLIDQVGADLVKPTARKAMTVSGTDKLKAAGKATTGGLVTTPVKKPAKGSDRNFIPVPKL